ncbi:MAG TPA: phosphoribosylformylglycinamidine synthase subunit PurS [Candidatus Saccharimonadales bacterium]|nr:phosphoribosylformylglycinamidine synthase subunit PurS [Candidatus Saccharimonadales bacterium]
MRVQVPPPAPISMSNFLVKIEVYPKDGMPDPKSSDEQRRLDILFPESSSRDLKIRKLITFVIEAPESNLVPEIALNLCKDILAQPVLEDYDITTIEPYIESL